MKLLIETWNKFIQVNKDMKRVSKAIMIGDMPNFNDGKVLILKRNKTHVTKESPYEWDLPGGHIQEGESDKHGLAREVTEETNLNLPHIPKWFMLSGHTRFYVINDWTGELQLSHEHDDYEWIYPQEVTNYKLGKMYSKAIQAAFEENK